jgi:type IV secretion system protein VirB10
MIGAIVVVVGLWFYMQHRAVLKAEEARVNKTGKDEIRPAQVAQRREFKPMPPMEPAKAEAKAATEPSQSNCKNVMVLDAKGVPMMGADNRPIMIGCDGKVVPAIDSNATPGNVPGAGNNANQPPSPKPPSRYAGDVLIASTGGTASGGAGADNDSGIPNRAPKTNSEGMELLAGLLRRTGVSSNASPTPPITPPDSQSSAARDASVPVVNNAGLSGGDAGIPPSSRGAVGGLLTPTITNKTTAAMIGNRDMIVSKGTHIDCTLTTKIINEVSGFASCQLPNNIYSDNGKVLLMERGSEVMGEYVAKASQGQRRLFVLWDRVKTPTGVIIDFKSPAADSLGTMGIGGYVDNRWAERIGAAFMLSFVKDVIAYEIAKSSAGANTQAGGIAFQNSTRTGESMAEKVLEQTIGIPPTIYKNQGDLASIYVARDLDFSTVYQLRVN